jgi:hypothetical protein
MARKNLAVEAQKSGRNPGVAHAGQEALRRRLEARKAQTIARVMAAFPAELTSYRTARELAAATGLAESTLGPRLVDLIADGALERDGDGIHRPRPGRRYDWEGERVAGRRQLDEHVKREDLADARQAARQRLNAALAALQEASASFGPRAPQNWSIAGDAAILMACGKRLERCTTKSEMTLMVDDAFAALESPISEWIEATRWREEQLALQQAELDRSWSEPRRGVFLCPHGLPPDARHQSGQTCPVPDWVRERIGGGQQPRKRTGREGKPAAINLFSRIDEAVRAQRGLARVIPPLALPPPTT